MEFSIYIWKIFLWKKERLHSAGYRAQDLSIAGRMLYPLSYGGSTKLFSQNLFTPIWLRIIFYLYILIIWKGIGFTICEKWLSKFSSNLYVLIEMNEWYNHIYDWINYIFLLVFIQQYRMCVLAIHTEKLFIEKFSIIIFIFTKSQ